MPAKFEGCVLSDMEIKETSLSPALSINLLSIRMSSSLGICSYLCLPPPVRSVHFGITAFLSRNAVKAMLSGVNQMLTVGWLANRPFHAVPDVSTPEFDRSLVIVIPSDILESV